VASEPTSKESCGPVVLAGWTRAIGAAVFIALLLQCQPNGPTSREEKYVTVRLNDSLKRYDSVEISILVAGDTSTVIGTVWKGPLPNPGAIPSYKLDNAEERNLSIRVRGFDSTGALTLNMLISKNGGTQTVADLPVPKLPVIIPIDTVKPKPSLRLASLGIFPGGLVPVFDSAHGDYLIKLVYAESTLLVTAVPVYAQAGLSIAALPLVSGKASDPIPLKVGDNTLVLKVTAGGETGIYTLLVSRPDKIPPDSISIPVTDSGYPAWKYHRTVDIHINYTGMAPGNLIRNCPMLVRLTKDNFDFSQAAEGGKDIRFTTANGKPIGYEIARWEATGGSTQADIWVEIDSIRTEEDSAHVIMYHGNPSAKDASDGAKVFGAADGDGFSGVWHLSEQAKGVPDEFRDATGKHHGMGGAGDGKHLTTRVDGVVGYGQSFTGGLLGNLVTGLGTGLGNGQPVITIPRTFDPGNQAWSFQAWINRSGNRDGVIFDKGDEWLASKQRFQIVCMGGGTNQIAILREGAEYYTNVYLPQNVWTMVSMAFNGSRLDIYVDGYFRESKTFTQGGEPIGKAVFGSSEPDGSAEGFSGILDETWFSNQVRSQYWLRLAYEFQKPLAAIVMVRPLK